MIYSRVLPDNIDLTTNSSEYEHEDDSLFKDPATYTIKDSDKYISISGTITYKNSWGYLNAER